MPKNMNFYILKMFRYNFRYIIRSFIFSICMFNFFNFGILVNIINCMIINKRKFNIN